MTRNILVTGGAGYIGSHTCVELVNSGYNPIIVDNFSTSTNKSINRIEMITKQKIESKNCDIRDTKSLIKYIKSFNCEAVIHFAGFKSVEESEEKPLNYFVNNISGSLSLLEAMTETGLNKIIFSSSATVYGKPNFLPLTEEHSLIPENVYGKTKLMFENILRDISNTNANWNICILRYFNPIGAHKSGLIGDNPKNIPNNLMPYLTQVAIGKRHHLNIFGDDYDTKDGTGIRDYIHVVDLAKGHIKALQKIIKIKCESINLGTGTGYSVLEIIKSFEKACGKKIKIEFKNRRKGDIDKNYADPSKAKNLLGWEAEMSIEEMCLDSWNWQKNNPSGFQ